VPTPDAIDRTGLNISDEALQTLLTVESLDWAEASADQAAFLTSLGARVPKEMFDEQSRLAVALGTK